MSIRNALNLPPRLLTFPVSVGNVAIADYRHECLSAMRVWVAAQFAEIERLPATEHVAWTLVTDRAVKAISRPLRRAEGDVITEAIRDIYHSLRVLQAQAELKDTQERLHRPGNMFA